MNDETFDRQALNDALRRGDIRTLDNLGFPVSVHDVETANQSYARLIGRSVETFTEQDTQQAMRNWILAGRP